MRMQCRKSAGRSGDAAVFSLGAFLLVVLLCGLAFCPPVLGARGVSYKGLTPGVSTLADTLRLLGAPVSKVFSDDRIVCNYRFVQVNIPKKTGKVQYIIISDPSFRDVNGFRLGSHSSEIREELKVDGTGNSLVDAAKGIGYIFNSAGLVDRIVYGMVR